MSTASSVNFAQSATLIETCGANNTFLFQGAPGVGKSALLSHLARRMPDYNPCYIDVANLDLGDLGMPVIDRDHMITNYAPNVRFGIGKDQTRPVLLMLDELGKGPRPIINMLLPVILEHRLGDVKLPKGSIVFGTTNLASDGVGDNIPAHAHNRMSVLDFSNPTADEWINWAAGHNIVPEVMAFAKQYPTVFDRYDTCGDDSNPYIFDPRRGRTKAFCSPRSLEKASNLVASRHALGAALLPALIGTVGESAAREMEAFTQLADRMPTYEDIVSKPKKAALPDGVGAYFMSAFMLSGRVEAEHLDAVIEYVQRWDQFESKCLFLATLCAGPKVSMACKNRTFTQMAQAHGKFF